MIFKKTPEELLIMREGGKALAEILKLLATQVKEGASTADIDKEGERRIRNIGGEPAFKGYRAFDIPTPFPGSVCISINEEIVHGSPYPDRIFKEGDVVKLDIGMKYKGLFVDMATTVGVGRITENKQDLIDVCKKSLQLVIEELKELVPQGRATTATIGRVIQEYVEGSGFEVVRELVGHGIGRALHEDPSVPNFITKKQGDILLPGMAIAVEPMIYQGPAGVSFERNGWRVFTTHGGVAAHFEHSIAIYKDGIVVLTEN